MPGYAARAWSPRGERSTVVLAVRPHHALDPRRGERLAAARARRVGDVGGRALRVPRREQQRVHLAVDGDAEPWRPWPVVVAEPRDLVVRQLPAGARTLEAVGLPRRCAVVAGRDDPTFDDQYGAHLPAPTLRSGRHSLGDAEEVRVPVGHRELAHGAHPGSRRELVSAGGSDRLEGRGARVDSRPRPHAVGRVTYIQWRLSLIHI